ncbi:ADP-ribosyltransferase [Nocardia pseudovaccinii]|uniref:ADP-ribosyltransferase n=1 Tax=Nocardia pseudovaccinii TaxID=189540 RepID=UPI003D94D49A
MGIEIPDELQWVAKYVVGAGDWPEGDETAMRRIGHAWGELATALGEIRTDSDHVAQAALNALEAGQTHDAFDSYWNQVDGQEGMLPQLIESAKELSDQIDDGAADIEHTKYVIIGALVVFAIQMIQAIATAATGIGAPAAAAEEAAFQVATRLTIRMVIKELIQKLMSRATAKAAFWGVMQSAGVDLGASVLQMAQGKRGGLTLDEAKNLGRETLTGAIGGALGGALGSGGVGSHAVDAVESKVGKFATQTATDAAAGAVGVVAGTAATVPVGGKFELDPTTVATSSLAGAAGATAGQHVGGAIHEARTSGNDSASGHSGNTDHDTGNRAPTSPSSSENPGGTSSAGQQHSGAAEPSPTSATGTQHTSQDTGNTTAPGSHDTSNTTTPSSHDTGNTPGSHGTGNTPGSHDTGNTSSPSSDNGGSTQPNSHTTEAPAPTHDDNSPTATQSSEVGAPQHNPSTSGQEVGSTPTHSEHPVSSTHDSATTQTPHDSTPTQTAHDSAPVQHDSSANTQGAHQPSPTAHEPSSAHHDNGSPTGASLDLPPVDRPPTTTPHDTGTVANDSATTQHDTTRPSPHQSSPTGSAQHDVNANTTGSQHDSSTTQPLGHTSTPSHTDSTSSAAGQPHPSGAEPTVSASPRGADQTTSTTTHQSNQPDSTAASTQVSSADTATTTGSSTGMPATSGSLGTHAGAGSNAAEGHRSSIPNYTPTTDTAHAPSRTGTSTAPGHPNASPRPEPARADTARPRTDRTNLTPDIPRATPPDPARTAPARPDAAAPRADRNPTHTNTPSRAPHEPPVAAPRSGERYDTLWGRHDGATDLLQPNQERPERGGIPVRGDEGQSRPRPDDRHDEQHRPHGPTGGRDSPVRGGTDHAPGETRESVAPERGNRLLTEGGERRDTSVPEPVDSPSRGAAPGEGEHGTDHPSLDGSGENVAPEQSQSGGTIRPRNPLDYAAQDKWARDAYETIRASGADVHDMAENLSAVTRGDGSIGFSEHELGQVKQHLFEDDHKLSVFDDDGNVVGYENRRFDADPDIAEAWMRLSRGEPLPADIRLLEHELAEAGYLREYPDASYHEAHAHANTKANWEDDIPGRTGENYQDWGDKDGAVRGLPEDRGNRDRGDLPVREQRDRTEPGTGDREERLGRQSGGRNDRPTGDEGRRTNTGAEGDRSELAGRRRNPGLNDQSPESPREERPAGPTHQEAPESQPDPSSTPEEQAAKDACDRLPQAEREAIEDYAGDAYNEINRHLRFGEELHTVSPETIELIRSGLDKLPDHVGPVKRSIMLAPEAIEKFWYDNRPGAVVEDPGFVSTSKTQFKWNPNVKLTIVSATGKDISFLRPPGKRGEAEVLIPDGRQFRVLDREMDSDGTLHITWEEITDSPRSPDSSDSDSASTPRDLEPDQPFPQESVPDSNVAFSLDLSDSAAPVEPHRSESPPGHEPSAREKLAPYEPHPEPTSERPSEPVHSEGSRRIEDSDPDGYAPRPEGKSDDHHVPSRVDEQQHSPAHDSDHQPNPDRPKSLTPHLKDRFEELRTLATEIGLADRDPARQHELPGLRAEFAHRFDKLGLLDTDPSSTPWRLLDEHQPELAKYMADHQRYLLPAPSEAVERAPDSHSRSSGVDGMEIQRTPGEHSTESGLPADLSPARSASVAHPEQPRPQEHPANHEHTPEHARAGEHAPEHPGTREHNPETSDRPNQPSHAQDRPASAPEHQPTRTDHPETPHRPTEPDTAPRWAHQDPNYHLNAARLPDWWPHAGEHTTPRSPEPDTSTPARATETQPAARPDESSRPNPAPYRSANEHLTRAPESEPPTQSAPRARPDSPAEASHPTTRPNTQHPAPAADGHRPMPDEGQVHRDGVRRFGTDDAGQRYGDNRLARALHSLPSELRNAVYKYTVQSFPNGFLRGHNPAEAVGRHFDFLRRESHAVAALTHANHGRMPTKSDLEALARRPDLNPYQRQWVDYLRAQPDTQTRLDKLKENEQNWGFLHHYFEGPPTVERFNQLIAEIDAAITTPLPESVQVIRGLHDISFLETAEGHLLGNGDPRALIGTVQAERSHMSTSLGTNLTQVDGHNYRIRVEMNVPAGTPGLWMGRNSHYPDQRELILPRNLEYRITNVVQTGWILTKNGHQPTYTVHAEVVQAPPTAWGTSDATNVTSISEDADTDETEYPIIPPTGT